MSQGLYKRSGIWWGRLRENGKVVRRSLKTRDRLEAERKMAVLRGETTTEMQSVQYLTQTWLASKVDEGRSTNTINSTRYHAKAIATYFGSRSIQTLTQRDITDYRKWREEGSESYAPASNETLRQALLMLKFFLSWCRKQKIQVPEELVIERLPGRAKFNEHQRCLSEEQIAKVLKVAREKDPHLAAVILISYYFGPRTCDLVRLRVDSYRNGRLRWRPSKTSNSTGEEIDRRVPESLVKVLDGLLEGPRLSHDRLINCPRGRSIGAFHRWLREELWEDERLEFMRHRPQKLYSFRHTRITRLAKAGYLTEAAAGAGITKETALARYSHTSPEAVDKADAAVTREL